MYSRYIPGPDGVHRREAAASPVKMPPPAEPEADRSLPSVPPPAPGLRQQLSARLPGKLELGDVLVLLIALLLLIDAEEDLQTILITAAAFFLL